MAVVRALLGGCFHLAWCGSLTLAIRNEFEMTTHSRDDVLARRYFSLLAPQIGKPLSDRLALR